LSYKDFSPKGIPVSLGVMAFCKWTSVYLITQIVVI
jgi:hypothetical protein